jgi:hypothetical protein
MLEPLVGAWRRPLELVLLVLPKYTLGDGLLLLGVGVDTNVRS